MGVYKQLDVAFEEAMMMAATSQDKELADTVAWYRAHHQVLPAELMRAILTDEEFFQKALTVWDNERFSPKPASEHVALQQETLKRIRDRKPKRSRMCVVGWVMIAASIVVSVTILVVNL